MHKNEIVKNYFYIIIGATLLAAGVNVFFDANQLVVGGVTGLGIIINAYSQMMFHIPIPLFLTNLIFNIPLLLLAYRFLGKDFLGKTVFATVYFSIALIYTKWIPVFHGDMALVAVYGGVLCGLGVGFVLRSMGTTGGTDLAAAILHRIYKHIPISQAIFVMDAVIIALGFFIFGAEKAMYAIIAVFITSKCIGTILEGMGFAKAAFIISDHSEQIAKMLLSDMDRGVTALYGKGMYSGKQKEILLCVFSQREVAKVKQTVNEIDKNAFLLLTDMKEVLGEGFQSLEKL